VGPGPLITPTATPLFFAAVVPASRDEGTGRAESAGEGRGAAFTLEPPLAECAERRQIS
jgi:hypothetical protein